MTDWTKSIYTDPADAPADHEVPAQLQQPTAAKLLDNTKTLVGHVAKGAVDGLNPANIAKGAWNIGSNMGADAASGQYLQAAKDLVGLTKAHQDMADARATMAFGQGNPIEGSLHMISKWFPGIGPLSDDTVSKLADGFRSGDYGKIGDGLGNIASMAGPEALKFTKDIPGMGAAAGSLERSAGENYMNTIRPIKPVSAASSAQRAANDLASGGNAPFASSRQSFIDKMRGAATQSGQNQADAINFDTTGAVGDANSLKAKILDNAYKKYTTPNADGSRSPRSPEGLAAAAELADKIDRASAAAHGTPGLVAPGQTPPAAGPPVVPHEAVEAWRRDLESTGGSGGNLTPTGTWRDRVSPDGAAAIDRAHARIIRNWQDEQDPNIQERRNPTRTASEMRDRLQDKQNRDTAGVPSNVPIWGALKNGKMPSFTTDSIPVNTAAAKWKAAVANSLKTGDWTKTAAALRGGKLASETDTEDGQ